MGIILVLVLECAKDLSTNHTKYEKTIFGIPETKHTGIYRKHLKIPKK
jgi:hypothetical protein